MRKQYINGEWCDAIDGATWDVQSPATEEIIDKVPFGNAKDCQLAIAAADASFATWKPGWQTFHPRTRLHLVVPFPPSTNSHAT